MHFNKKKLNNDKVRELRAYAQSSMIIDNSMGTHLESQKEAIGTHDPSFFSETKDRNEIDWKFRPNFRANAIVSIVIRDDDGVNYYMTVKISASAKTNLGIS